MNHRSLHIVWLILFAALFSGCYQPSSSSPPRKDTKTSTSASAHAVSEKTKVKILTDAKEDMEVLMAVKTATSELAKVFTEAERNRIRTAIKADLASGQIKLRSYKDMSFTLKNYTKGVAGVTFEYKDMSYYVDAESEKPVSKPENTTKKCILSLVEQDGRWKINTIFSPEIKPRGKK